MYFTNPEVIRIMSDSFIPLPLQLVISFTGIMVVIVSGIAILKGRNWGRYLYVIWTALGMLIAILTSPIVKLLPGLLVFIIFTAILFKPTANKYFSKIKLDVIQSEKSRNITK